MIVVFILSYLAVFMLGIVFTLFVLPALCERSEVKKDKNDVKLEEQPVAEMRPSVRILDI